MGDSCLEWLPYHIDRIRTVNISFHLFPDFSVSSEVFQGSYLDPLLFFIFIDDLSHLILESPINTNILLFVDNHKIFYNIKADTDQYILQSIISIILYLSYGVKIIFFF